MSLFCHSEVLQFRGTLPAPRILHGMTLKGAALLALIGTSLATILTVWQFVVTLVNHLHGLVAAAVVLSSLVEAFAWLSVAVFFYVFHRTQARG
jgi:hypothetical protein